MNFVLEHLDVFPEWLKPLIAVTCGIALIVLMVFHIVRILQKEEMKSTYSLISKLSASFLKTLQKELDDPIKHPRLEYYLKWLNVIFSYMFSMILLLMFIILMSVFLFSAKKLSLYEHVVFFSFALLTLITAKAIKAHAGKDLVRLKSLKKAN